MEQITKFVDHLYTYPRVDQLHMYPKDWNNQPEEDKKQFLEQFLDHWGYTIYRTYYGPGSDEKWVKLLKIITDGVEKGLAKLKEADNKPDAVTKARDWFRLDARSLPTTLDGLTIEDVRQVYREGNGGQPMRGLQRNNWGTAIFLVADAQVLQEPDLNLLKVGDAKYDPVAAVPKNPRVGPQRYFGWFTIPTTAVLDFYNWMDIFTFEETFRQALPGTQWDAYERK
ncbi:hypothetical protein BKA58DRAFT_31352 [Alternaria rosae]|uniref:uncharacterized protein n=1 Tax=Alternaria rosae TaxID=1187941 RepID=UPI001E8EA45A|nr:uncharacterized protein BKA58DRAFT_31352 [Alternaria rosae]KAH6883153.1 hypothetical protein BKA58DRAFT_31352 [Alternaria rosae]